MGCERCMDANRGVAGRVAHAAGAGTSRLLRLAVAGGMRLLGALRARRRPASPRRVVVLAGGYLGDTFWAAQTLPEIQRACPGTAVWAVARAASLPLLRGFLPPGRCLAIETIVSDRGRERFRPLAFLRDLARVLRLRPDMVIDLMGNPFSAFFAWGLRAWAAGPALDPRLRPLYGFSLSPADLPGPHLALRPRAVVRRCFGLPDGPGFSLRAPEPACPPAAAARRLGFDPAGRLALLVPGAGWAAKRWAPGRFRELAARLAGAGWQVAVATASGESELREAVLAGLPGTARAVVDLGATLALLPLCGLCVGSDTGLTHVAEAAGVPCVALYCATNPALHAGPGPRVVNLAAPCPLAPGAEELHCGNFPRLVCERPGCMDISVDDVLAAARRLLESAGAGSGGDHNATMQRKATGGHE